MITSGCERMGCILRAVIECNLMVGRSKLKGSSIPELWSPIDKVQLPGFDHPCYQFTWWRAFLQYDLDEDVFLGGRSVVHWKGSGGGMSSPGQTLVVSKRVRVWLIAGQALLWASAEWPRTALRKCARQNNGLGCPPNVRKHNAQLHISCLALSKLVCGNLNIQDYCQADPKIYTH